MFLIGEKGGIFVRDDVWRQQRGLIKFTSHWRFQFIFPLCITSSVVSVWKLTRIDGTIKIYDKCVGNMADIRHLNVRCLLRIFSEFSSHSLLISDSNESNQNEWKHKRCQQYFLTLGNKLILYVILIWLIYLHIFFSNSHHVQQNFHSLIMTPLSNKHYSCKQ